MNRIIVCISVYERNIYRFLINVNRVNPGNQIFPRTQVYHEPLKEVRRRSGGGAYQKKINNNIDMRLPGFPLITGIYYFAALLPCLSLLVRRLHDVGKGGHWLLIALIPLAGSIGVFVLTVTEGTKGDNEFGPDPKAADVWL